MVYFLPFQHALAPVVTHLVTFGDRHVFPVYFCSVRHTVMIVATEIFSHNLLTWTKAGDAFEGATLTILRERYLPHEIVWDAGKSNVVKRGAVPALLLSLGAFCGLLCMLLANRVIKNIALARLREMLQPHVSQWGTSVMLRRYRFLKGLLAVGTCVLVMCIH
jgi:hypothetical protein